MARKEARQVQCAIPGGTRNRRPAESGAGRNTAGPLSVHDRRRRFPLCMLTRRPAESFPKVTARFEEDTTIAYSICGEPSRSRSRRDDIHEWTPQSLLGGPPSTCSREVGGPPSPSRPSHWAALGRTKPYANVTSGRPGTSHQRLRQESAGRRLRPQLVP